jgi:hypothetical protein
MALPARPEHLSPDPFFAPSHLAFETLPLLRLRRREQFLAERADLRGDSLLDDRSRIDDLGHEMIIAPTRTPLDSYVCVAFGHGPALTAAVRW